MADRNLQPRVRREVQELSLLFEISQVLDRSLDLRESVHPVLKAMADHMGMLRGSLTLLNRDIDDWTITFVDTGLQANIGQRLRAVRPFVADEEVFLANYADGLSDLPLDRYVEHFLARDKVACCLSTHPPVAFHMLEAAEDGRVSRLCGLRGAVRINGGFFVFRQAIFDYIREGEDLLAEPFRRLIAAGQLLTYPYDGFWQCMDTFKDKQALEDLAARDDAPWQVWKKG